jgi:RNA polymerase sigma-70 factor (ECF subfamily)
MPERVTDMQTQTPDFEKLYSENLGKVYRLSLRKIFCLAVTIGLPQATVADIMECSLSKVKTALSRAKQRWYGYMEGRCGLIKKSNPCNCSQWMRFGLRQGWFTQRDLSYDPDIEGTMRAMAELKDLKACGMCTPC